MSSSISIRYDLKDVCEALCTVGFRYLKVAETAEKSLDNEMSRFTCKVYGFETHLDIFDTK
jgi:hypothetical protein